MINEHKIIKTVKPKTMKKIILISILFVLLNAGCNSQKARTTYFKEQKTGKIYNRKELNRLDTLLLKKFKPMFKFAKVQNTIIDSTISHDSIIKTFKINIVVSNKMTKPKKEKVYSYLNKKLPSFDLLTLTNKTIDISKLDGKPTLLNFWFTSCAPCIAEMPVLNQIMNKYKGKVNFIAITYENKKSVESFLKKHKYNFIQIAGASEFIDTLGIKNFPKNIFIDRNGIVRRIEDGIPYKDKNDKLKMGKGKEFEEYIESLL
jgi:cytochrome c biogenesis protein CcmG/thiol:disulfide interchange protein DsbE